MATDILDPAMDSTSLAKRMYGDAQEIQDEVHRIQSLAEAIDHAIDFSSAEETVRRRLGRALDYLWLLKETAAKVQDRAEQIEIGAGRLERGAAQ